MSRINIKNLLPRSLFGRAALIYFVPVLTILGVVSVVFIQRLYEDVTRQMTMSAMDEVELILSEIKSAPNKSAAIERSRQLAGPLAIEVSFSDVRVDTRRSSFDLSGSRIFSTVFERRSDVLGIDLVARDGWVRLKFASIYGDLTFDMPRTRFNARNPHQFLVLMGFTAIVMTLIALLYLRGQVRPIRRLAAAASAFGKGHVLPYRPSGAREVREAGSAFIQMRDRIERQIEQRTMMLSGVSHDLKTPLTRMRLALGLMDDDETTRSLNSDVDEMDRMLNAFLEFARAGKLDDPVEHSLVETVQHSVVKAQRAGWNVSLGRTDEIANMVVRPLALSRALDNLIGNACRYANCAIVELLDRDNVAVIRVSDDGPGIPVEERATALKAFSRFDVARNQNAGSGVGLGLAIANEIARQHGGQLNLGRCEDLGGLRAEILIPR